MASRGPSCSPRLGAEATPSAHAAAKQALSLVEELRSDFRALRECLEASGVLSEQRFSAALHRQKFLRMLHAVSGWECMLNASLEDLSRGPLTNIAAFLGHSTGLAFRCASSAVQGNCLKASEMHSPRFFLWGGYSGERQLETGISLDLATGEWTQLPPMPLAEAASAGATALVAGKVYVAGGFTGTRNKSSALRFDLRSHAWERLPPMSTGRFGCSGADLGGSFCVAGGNSGLQRLDSVERFLPQAGRWESLPAMSVPRVGAACAVLQGRLFVCGGQDLSSVEAFDQGRWLRAPAMTTKRFGACGAACGGCLYVAGGKGRGKGNLASAERLEPQQGRWEEIADMQKRRFGASCSSLQGRLYVFGGLETGGLGVAGGRLAEVECFDGATGRWESLPSMPQGRSAPFVASVVQARPSMF